MAKTLEKSESRKANRDRDREKGKRERRKRKREKKKRTRAIRKKRAGGAPLLMRVPKKVQGLFIFLVNFDFPIKKLFGLRKFFSR